MVFVKGGWSQQRARQQQAMREIDGRREGYARKRAQGATEEVGT